MLKKGKTPCNPKPALPRLMPDAGGRVQGGAQKPEALVAHLRERLGHGQDESQVSSLAKPLAFWFYPTCL